jgi:hypothetical protein
MQDIELAGISQRISSPGLRSMTTCRPTHTETDDHHSSFVDRKGHPNIQEAGPWIALWSLSASKPLTFRTSDQITHQINMPTPITGTNVTRTAPTTTYSSPPRRCTRRNRASIRSAQAAHRILRAVWSNLALLMTSPPRTRPSRLHGYTDTHLRQRACV